MTLLLIFETLLTPYFQENGRICGGCGKPVVAGKIITMKAEGNNPQVMFHKEHFNCTYCHINVFLFFFKLIPPSYTFDLQMAGQRYKRKDGKQYCTKCHLQLFE